jgi:hypothetical protein
MLKAGDVYVVAGKGWMSNAIRFLTRRVGESKSRASHVGMIVKGSPDPMVMEALPKGITRREFSRIGPRHAVYRPPWNDRQLAITLARAAEDEGKAYGWAKVVSSGLDWFLNDAYLFRRLTDRGGSGLDCSFAVWDWTEAAFRMDGQQPFGVNRNCSPDDIDDYVRKHWECVKEMA